ncbi:MAG: hypothetical protein ACREC6_12650 [Hyphomicrobiaceae bacterium]
MAELAKLINGPLSQRMAPAMASGARSPKRLPALPPNTPYVAFDAEPAPQDGPPPLNRDVAATHADPDLPYGPYVPAIGRHQAVEPQNALPAGPPVGTGDVLAIIRANQAGLSAPDPFADEKLRDDVDKGQPPEDIRKMLLPVPPAPRQGSETAIGRSYDAGVIRFKERIGDRPYGLSPEFIDRLRENGVILPKSGFPTSPLQVINELFYVYGVPVGDAALRYFSSSPAFAAGSFGQAVEEFGLGSSTRAANELENFINFLGLRAIGGPRAPRGPQPPRPSVPASETEIAAKKVGGEPPVVPGASTVASTAPEAAMHGGVSPVPVQAVPAGTAAKIDAPPAPAGVQQEGRVVLSANVSGRLRDPRDPGRSTPIEEYYGGKPLIGPDGRLLTPEGVRLTAPRIVGREFPDKPDQGLRYEDIEEIANLFLNNRVRPVRPSELPRNMDGLWILREDPNLNPIIEFLRNLVGKQPRGIPEIIYNRYTPQGRAQRVIAHELGHHLIYKAPSLTKNIPPEVMAQMRQIYADLALPVRGRRVRQPEDYDYRVASIADELVVETIRAYMFYPQYAKQHRAATEWIRRHLNENPEIADKIQFNSLLPWLVPPAALGMASKQQKADDDEQY